MTAKTQSTPDAGQSGGRGADLKALTALVATYSGLAFNQIRKVWHWLLAVLVFALLYVSGVFDQILPSTYGIVRIESPQIYTRERLVNDRFREQAWLEKQFNVIDQDDGFLSGRRNTNIQFNVTGNSEKGVTSPDSGKTGDESVPKKSNTDIVVDPANAFEKKRERRAALRRALIENELDDRHDLGSNSLYQFNFGAAIIAGPRTRKVAYIGMKIKPVAALRPLSRVVNDPEHRCHELYQFECGYLFDRGILSAKSEEEKAVKKSFKRWKELFNHWIATENSDFRKEARGIQRLLQSPEATEQLKSPMKKFFIQLDDKIKRAVSAIESVLKQEKSAAEDLLKKCRDSSAKKSISESFLQVLPIGHKTSSSSFMNVSTRSIDEILRNITSSCSFYMNEHLKNNNFDDELVLEFLREEGGYDIDVSGKITDPVRFRRDLYGSFFKLIFSNFNKQCSWKLEIVKASGALDESVKMALLDCIYNALVRDFGSHPFSRVSRDEFSGGNNANLNASIGRRSVESNYSAYRGLSDIVDSIGGAGTNGRFSGQTNFIGLIHSPPVEGSFPTYEKISNNYARASRICKDHGMVEGPDLNPEHFGVTGGYYKYQVSPSAEPQFGQTFLVHLICHKKKMSLEDEGLERPNFIDGSSHVPTGLFRFIKILSDGQKNFSYSVQPSGVFDLERQTARQSLVGNNLFDQPALGLSVGGEARTSSEHIEKKYRVVGYGGQGEDESPEITLATLPQSGSKTKEDCLAQSSSEKHKNLEKCQPKKRVAEFGWYIFPVSQQNSYLSKPLMESANVKLTAQISLPAWWDSVDLIIKKSWLDPDNPQKPINDSDPHTSTTVMRVDLPIRLKFIRNHFPDSFSIQPTLYQLQIPRVEVPACQEAHIILKGERLWRSTVVTLGGQKATSIEVMPNMGGIIAKFDKVLPDTFSGVQKTSIKTPVTIWTSEGEQTVVDSVTVFWPDLVRERMINGEPPCPVSQTAAAKTATPTSK